MKILYISTFDIAGSNGPGVNEYETAKELIRLLVNDVHFIIPKPSKALELVSANADNFTLMTGIDRKSVFRVFTIQKKIINAFRNTVKYFVPDVLLYRPMFCPYAQIKCSKEQGIPYVVKTLGIGIFNPSGTRNGIKGMLIGLLKKKNESLMRELIENASAIDVCTSEYKQYFGEKYPKVKNRIHLIENAVNTDEFTPLEAGLIRKELKLDSFDKIIGFTGGSPYIRGGKLMIESAPLLVSEFPNVGIVIVGPKDENLINAYNSSPYKKHIILTDKVPYELVPKYINCFDVCVSCDSADIIANFGNSSQKVRQYLACGKPVLSGGSQDTAFITDNGLGEVIDDVNDVKSFTDAAIRLLSLSQLERKQLEIKATQYALDNLSVRRSFALRIKIWKECLSGE